MDATDWGDASIKEAKQAEFLVYASFPWELVERIGVYDHQAADQVAAVLKGAAHEHGDRLQEVRKWEEKYGSSWELDFIAFLLSWPDISSIVPMDHRPDNEVVPLLS